MSVGGHAGRGVGGSGMLQMVWRPCAVVVGTWARPRQAARAYGSCSLGERTSCP
mgnify:CR=1 FL=1